MRISFPRHARAGLAVALLCAPLVQAGGELAHGERGIVATVHPLATDADGRPDPTNPDFFV